MSASGSSIWGHLNDGGKRLVFVAVGTTALSTTFVVMRLAFGKEPKRRFMVDDIFILVACTLNIIMNILTILSVYWGFGNPTDTLSAVESSNALLVFWVTQALYKPVMVFTKLSVLAFLVQCFGRIMWFRRCCHLLIAYIVLYNIGSTAASIFQCTPIDRAWNKSIPGTCINLTASWYSNAVASITSELAIVVLPMHPVCKLHVSTKRRIHLALVFGVGLIVVVCSALRMTSLEASSTAIDKSTGSMISTCWTLAESGVAIAGACLVFLKRPFDALVVRVSKVFGPSFTASNLDHRGSSHRSMQAWRYSASVNTTWDDVDQVLATRMDSIHSSLRGEAGDGPDRDKRMSQYTSPSIYRHSHGSDYS